MSNKWFIAGAALLLAMIASFYAGASFTARRASKQAQVAQAQSDAHAGAAQVHAAEAAQLHAQGEQAAQKSTDAHTKSEIAGQKTRAALAALPTIPVTQEGEKYKAALDTALAENTALKDENAKLRLENSLAHAEADAQRQRAEEDEKALALQKIASDAAIRSEHAQGVKSQLIHVGETAVVAYLAGRYTSH